MIDARQSAVGSCASMRAADILTVRCYTFDFGDKNCKVIEKEKRKKEINYHGCLKIE